MSTCACLGPRNGEPLCPCKMRAVRAHDARVNLAAKASAGVGTLKPIKVRRP